MEDLKIIPQSQITNQPLRLYKVQKRNHRKTLIATRTPTLQENPQHLLMMRLSLETIEVLFLKQLLINNFSLSNKITCIYNLTSTMKHFQRIKIIT